VTDQETRTDLMREYDRGYADGRNFERVHGAAQAQQSSSGSMAPPADLADRIELYLEDAPSNGGHSDNAGGNCWELLNEAMERLRGLAQQPLDRDQHQRSSSGSAIALRLNERTDAHNRMAVGSGDQHVGFYTALDYRLMRDAAQEIDELRHLVGELQAAAQVTPREGEA